MCRPIQFYMIAGPIPCLILPREAKKQYLLSLQVSIAEYVEGGSLSSVADPDGSFVTTGAWNLEVPVSKPVGPAICHRGCAYTVLQTVQRPGV